MNKQRRNQLGPIMADLENARQRLQTILDDEQDAYDNMPEGLQNGNKGEKSQTAIDHLQYAVDDITDCIEYIEEARE